MHQSTIRTNIASPLASLVGPVRSWFVLAFAVVVAALVIAFSPEPVTGSEAGSNLPDSAESAQATVAFEQLPDAGEAPAFAVYSRDGEPLTDDDLAAIASAVERLGDDLGEQIGGPIPSDDGTVVLLTVPVDTGLAAEVNSSIVEQIRQVAATDLPTGLQMELTGAPAVFADLGEVFSGADTRLLAVTAAVVAILLLITYRSPWLWLVPLSVIGLGDRTAASTVETISAWTGLPIDGSISGITSVLVFGAGTNYALLVIARYREELHRYENRFDAMRHAVSGAAPAILASSTTVILGLIALLLADSPFVERIGMAGAIGIAVAVIFALVVLPSAMSLPGRWLFWPFVPRFDAAYSNESGWWFRLGERVTARPWPTLLSSTLVLVLLALGTLGLRTGLAQSDQFLDTPESIRAQETLSSAFPAGLANPTTIATSTELAERVAEAAETVAAVTGPASIETAGPVAEVTVTLSTEPSSDESAAAVSELRQAVQQVDSSALVGGADAEALDERQTAASDRLLIIPVVLLVVLVMLYFLLRSVVASVLLTLTTVLSYLSALGLGWLLFDWVFGWPATDVSTPLLAFIFLVALGIDYNIFLTARAREEFIVNRDARRSMVTALAVTGSVITSAGILLAAVFTVLGVLPLVLLAQLGVIVGLGVLLDTMVVRSIMTPAMVSILGARFWQLAPDGFDGEPASTKPLTVPSGKLVE